MNPLRRLLAWGPLERLVGLLLCSRQAKPSWRFVARELAGRGGVGRYRLRSSGVVVHVRHRTPDLHSFDQAICRNEFALAPEARAGLERLGRPIDVLDLGANIGLFGAFVLGELPVARIVAVEADSANADLHQRTVEANTVPGGWELVRACAAVSEGTVQFVTGDYGRSRTASGGEPAVEVPSVDVLPLLHQADLVKLDIEGSEWEILTDPRFEGCSAVAMHVEYHARLCPAPAPRAFALQCLEQAGYSARPLLESSPGNGVLWAWREPA